MQQRNSLATLSLTVVLVDLGDVWVLCARMRLRARVRAVLGERVHVAVLHEHAPADLVQAVAQEAKGEAACGGKGLGV